MTEAQRVGLDRLVPGARTVFVALFPYLAPGTEGNLSIYARGRDYHAVIAEALAPVVREAEAAFPGHVFWVLADDSPLPEVRAAVLAGLGRLGDHGLLIHPAYGSYVFLGTIVTDLDWASADAPSETDCLHCGACARACPVGLHKERCLSALTQRGGELTPEEAEAIRQHPLIWGCDLCQTACPLNRDARLTDNPAFLEDRIDRLTAADLDGLTRRAFLEKYPDRAFTWRGPAPLRRNLALKGEST